MCLAMSLCMFALCGSLCMSLAMSLFLSPSTSLSPVLSLFVLLALSLSRVLPPVPVLAWIRLGVSHHAAGRGSFLSCDCLADFVSDFPLDLRASTSLLALR